MTVTSFIQPSIFEFHGTTHDEKSHGRRGTPDPGSGLRWTNAAEAKAVAEELWNADLDGFVTKIEHAEWNEDSIAADGVILRQGPRGLYPAGKFTRTIVRDDDGTLHVEHDKLKLQTHLQGHGFGAAFYAHSEAKYREHGVADIRLEANITVGGYAWAKAGFDFDMEESATRIFFGELKEELQGWANRYTDGGEDDEFTSIMGEISEKTKKTVRSLIPRLEKGHPNPPTPLEIAQLGVGDKKEYTYYEEGANWDDSLSAVYTHLGKSLLMGSSWKGIRRLT